MEGRKNFGRRGIIPSSDNGATSAARNARLVPGPQVTAGNGFPGPSGSLYGGWTRPVLEGGNGASLVHGRHTAARSDRLLVRFLRPAGSSFHAGRHSRSGHLPRCGIRRGG